MTIYIIVFILLLLPLFFKREQSDSHYDAYFWFEFCLLFLLMGLRFRVGGDSIRYESYYLYHPDLEELFQNGWLVMVDGFQPLWVLFQAACKSITDDFVVVQLIHNIVVNGTIFYNANRDVKNRFTFVILYYLTWYLYFNTEIMRESLAVCCFLFSMKYLIGRRYLKYYLWSTIAFLFHASAVFLFILPIIYPFFNRLNGIKSYAVVVVLSIIASHYVSSILDFLNSSLFAGNSLLQHKSEDLAMSSGLNIFGIIVKVMSLVPVIWTISVKRHDNQRECNFILLMYLFVSVMGIIYLPLVRLENYFSILFIYIFADTIATKKYLYRNQIVVIAMVFILIGNRFDYYMHGLVSSSGVSKDFKRYELYIPYHSVFDKKYDSKRERAIENQFN